MFDLNIILISVIFVICLFSLCNAKNLIKKIISLSLLSNSILIFYIYLGKSNGNTAPIIKYLNDNDSVSQYVDPLPQVLMLTAIVVGFAILCVASALIIKIKENFGSIEYDKILENYNYLDDEDINL